MSRTRWPLALTYRLWNRRKNHPVRPDLVFGHTDTSTTHIWRNWFFADSTGVSGQGQQSSNGSGTVSGIGGSGTSGQGQQSSSGSAGRGPRPRDTAIGRGLWPHLINVAGNWRRRAAARWLGSFRVHWADHDPADFVVWRNWFYGGASGLGQQGRQSSSGNGTVSGIAGSNSSQQGRQSSSGNGTVSGIAGSNSSQQGRQSSGGIGVLSFGATPTGVLYTAGFPNFNVTPNVTTRAYDLSGSQKWAANHGYALRAAAADNEGNLITGGDRLNNITTRKYNKNGDLLWTVDHGTGVNSVAVDLAGYVYTGGEVWDATTRKYTANGILQWSTNHNAAVYAIACDLNGNVYTGGSPSSGITTRKYSNYGAALWTANHGSSVYTVIVDYFGNVYTGGSGSSGVHIRKYAADGALLWSASAAGTVYSLALRLGRLYAGGNGFIAQYDLDGIPINGNGWPIGGLPSINSIAVDPSGAVYCGGYRSDNITTRKYDSGGTLLWAVDHGATYVMGVALYIPPLQSETPGLAIPIALAAPTIQSFINIPALAIPLALAVPSIAPPPQPPDSVAAPIALQTLYRLYVTGGELLQLPLESFQGRRRLGESAWVTTLSPFCSQALLDDLAQRRAADARLVLYTGARYADGTEQIGEFLQSVLTEIDGEQEPYRGALRLTGRVVPIAFTPQTRQLYGVHQRGITASGKRTAACLPDPLLRPNDTVNDGQQNWIVGAILYRVGTQDATMTVTEA